MRIGIVLNPYNEEKPSGLGRFIYEIASALIEGDAKNEYLVYVKGAPKKLPIFSGGNWRICTGGKGLLWLDLLLFRNEPSDVYLFNTPSMPLFFRPRRSVVIALDFAYRHLPSDSIGERVKRFFLFRYHRFSLRKATHIVATSETTKKDVIELFHLPSNKITVIYPGFISMKRFKEEPVPVPPHYFYYMGVIKERKNVFAMVKAFVRFKELYPSDYQFLVAGNPSGEYYEKIQTFLAETPYSKDVVFLGYVTDGQAAYLYKHARAFIFTTLIEGATGMPVLEAMDAGTPVITSNAPTSTEVNLGEAALLADPENAESIAQAMEQIAKDDALRSALVEKGRRFAAEFSWEKGARSYRKVFSEQS